MLRTRQRRRRSDQTCQAKFFEGWLTVACLFTSEFRCFPPCFREDSCLVGNHHHWQARSTLAPRSTLAHMTVSTLVAALCWQAAGPSPAFRHARQHAASMAVVDLFPDPPSVAGVLIKAKDSKFPLVLEQPTDIARSVPISAPNWLQPGTLPFDPSDVLLAPLDVPDLGAALFVHQRVETARPTGATARWSDGLGLTLQSYGCATRA